MRQIDCEKELKLLNTSLVWLEGTEKDRPFTVTLEELKDLALTTVGQQLYMFKAIPQISETQFREAEQRNRLQESIMQNSMLQSQNFLPQQSVAESIIEDLQSRLNSE